MNFLPGFELLEPPALLHNLWLPSGFHVITGPPGVGKTLWMLSRISQLQPLCGAPTLVYPRSSSSLTGLLRHLGHTACPLFAVGPLRLPTTTQRFHLDQIENREQPALLQLEPRPTVLLLDDLLLATGLTTPQDLLPVLPDLLEGLTVLATVTVPRSSGGLFYTELLSMADRVISITPSTTAPHTIDITATGGGPLFEDTWTDPWLSDGIDARMTTVVTSKPTKPKDRRTPSDHAFTWLMDHAHMLHLPAGELQRLGLADGVPDPGIHGWRMMRSEAARTVAARKPTEPSTS